MPELAEVEFFRKTWNPGLKQPVLRVAVHADKRIFRGTDVAALAKGLTGKIYQNSEAHGKQMIFRFGSDAWLGLHLGMTGKLRTEPAGFKAGKHDHLVLFQQQRALVFSDPRLFGRVRFHQGGTPDWWQSLPPALSSKEFTLPYFADQLVRHARAPIKAVLLKQERFPGIGNWMADEILWQGRCDPRRLAGSLTATEVKRLHAATRHVVRHALRSVGASFADPPTGWLFHTRWSAHGRCPIHQTPLMRGVVGGRTTAWCPRCQKPV